MSVTTIGRIHKSLSFKELEKAIEKRLDVTQRMDILESPAMDFARSYFNYKEEDRILSIILETKETIVMLNHWGSSVEIVTSILKEYGGVLIEQDILGIETLVEKE